MNDPVFIIVLLMLGVAAIFAFFKVREKKKRIIENGVEVKGVVFEYDNISIGKQEPFPVIRFVTKEGLWITEKADAALSRNILKEGQEVMVVYNSENPKEFIYKTSFDLSVIYYLFLIAGVICIIMGLWFAYKYLTSQN